MPPSNTWQLPPITLASRSPRRQALLQQIGVPFVLADVDVDESMLTDEAPVDYVQRVALEKAQMGRQMKGEFPVLGADTTVVFNHTALGKPRNAEDAAQMLQCLSGQTHDVLTAVAVVTMDSVHTTLSTSQVTFRPITTHEIECYWASGEPHDKAGGYAVQGLAATFIERIEGSYSGIMGLPLFETATLLREIVAVHESRSVA